MINFRKKLTLAQVDKASREEWDRYLELSLAKSDYTFKIAKKRQQKHRKRMKLTKRREEIKHCNNCDWNTKEDIKVCEKCGETLFKIE